MINTTFSDRDFSLLCSKCADSRLVGRSISMKLLIILYYALFTPVILFSAKGGVVSYWRPLNKRKDQVEYDNFYYKAVSEVDSNCNIVDIKYKLDWRFGNNFLILIISLFKSDGVDLFSELLSQLFIRKSYSEDVIAQLVSSEVTYVMNEANFEYQLAIFQVRKSSRLTRFIGFQHATYPAYSSIDFSEAQVSYYLANADEYYIWDEFTKKQYRLAGYKGKMTIKGRPASYRFDEYLALNAKSNSKYLFFLSGTHNLIENRNAINAISMSGMLNDFYFALHPNDDGKSYEEHIHKVNLGRSLNDYKAIISFSSTVVVELMMAKAPLIVIYGDRYKEYGDFISVHSIEQFIALIQSNETIEPSSVNNSVCVNEWHIL